MSVNQLASLSHTHQSSVSVVVSRLATAKLVKRTPSSADSRRLDLTVTSAGYRRLEANFVTPQQHLFEALGKLSSKRLSTLRSLLEEVIANSGFDKSTPPMFFESKSERSNRRRVPARPSRSSASA